MTVYERLDYDSGLSKQNPNLKYKVVYLTSGTNLTAAVVVDEPYEVETAGGRVRVNGIVIENTLYLFQTKNEDEAHYLATILNSNVLNDLIKPMQVGGGFGERHFHKRPLEFPIPRYDPGNPVHRRLAELGRAARERVRAALERALKELGYYEQVRRYYDYMYGRPGEAGQPRPLSPTQVARLRDHIRRNMVADLLAEIDELVRDLLSAPGRSNTLLDFT